MADSGTVPWRAWDGLDGVLYQFSPDGGGGYGLLMTDLSLLWEETLDAGELEQRLRALNPALEASGEQVLRCLTAAVGSADSGAVWGGGELLRLDSRRSGVPLRWEFRLHALPAGALGERLVCPLLAALSQTAARERRLLGEVAARDRELQDYRQSGARLTLLTLRTQPLDRDAFETEMAGQGLQPAHLVDVSGWRAPPLSTTTTPSVSPVKGAPAAAPDAPPEPPREDETEAADRRRRELKQRLAEEARRTEMERKRKKKKLNL